MAKDRYTKSKLMRMRKADLLSLAAGIEFISDENNKSDIANAILMMSVPVYETGEGPAVIPAGPDPSQSSGPTPAYLGIDDPDYPKSTRVRRILDSQKEE